MLTACATHVPQVLTTQVVPTAFTGQVVGSEEVWPQPQWWRSFSSQELSELIASAQTDNRDLAVAAARVLEAQAQTTIRRSALFPQINAQAQAQRASGNSTQSINSQPSSPTNSFNLTLGASYEVDLRGLERADLRAANENLKSARFAHQTVALTLTANVANAYFSVLTLRERTAIANEDINAIKSLLDVIKLKVATGKSSHLDLAQEQAQVEAVEAQLPMLEEQELEGRVALARLLGQPPELFQVREQSPATIRSPLVEPGLASDLLLRRPDVAQAEANLASAHANLDAARAAFLPQFSLTGNGGYTSTTIGALLRGPSFVWATGANLLQTIFDGGKLAGQKNLAAATQQELIASYQSAVLNAYADVEDALGQVTNNRKAEEHLRREVDSAREAFEIAQLQYRQGAADLLIVLQTQQTLFAARDQLAQTTLARLQAAVHLYEALGGGWAEHREDRTQFIASGVGEAAIEQ
jgi:NodT family efflux transporter outer membrane factor (OMF) lipoprotein